MLIININSIRNDCEEYSVDLSGERFNPDDEVFFKNPVKVDVSIYRTGDQVFIKGWATTKVVLTCGRCLEEYETDLKAELFFMAVPENYKHDQEEYYNENDNYFIIKCKSEQLDLEPEIKSSLLLSLPIKPLCKESCLGICQECGAVLNEGLCQCTKLDAGHKSMDKKYI